jgi:putative hydrolase of the HAD superfamily
MDLKKIKYIGFDLDNTLIDRDTAFGKSVRKLLNELSLFSEENFRSIIQKDNSGTIDRVDLYEWMIETIPLKDFTVEKLFNFFAENLGNFMKPDSEIVEMLTAFSQKYGLYLITNGSAKNQRNKISHTGLQSFFGKNIFVSGELGCVKPQKEIFDHVLSQLGITNKETIFIGDNPETDIHGANNAGIFSILIRKPYNINEKIYIPNLIIDSVFDLKAMLL